MRNNIFYNSNACGNSMGGYAPASSKGGHSNGGGSSYHDVFVNNTLYNNATQPGNESEGGSTAEVQIQNQLGGDQGNIYENNIVYAGTYNTSIFNYVPFSAKYPAPPATLNWNLYHSSAGYVEGTSIWWGDANTFKSFSNWQNLQRRRCKFPERGSAFCEAGGRAFPTLTPSLLLRLSTAAAPVFRAASAGVIRMAVLPTPFMAAPTSSGIREHTGGNIDIGAYENTGVAISNSLTVNLTSGTYTLGPGRTTILTVIVSAVPGGGGVPVAR